MFGLFRSKRNKAVHGAQLLDVAIYQANMDSFFERENLSIAGVPTENQIWIYATVVTRKLAEKSIGAEFSVESLNLKMKVSLLLAGIQCTHMLFRYAYSGTDTSRGKIGARKEIVIQNVCSSIMGAENDTPPDEAVGAMATAAMLYREIAARDAYLLKNLDYSWRLMFEKNDSESADEIIKCVNDLMAYQSSH